jgi:purine-binding chemotaxis protein CheW
VSVVLRRDVGAEGLVVDAVEDVLAVDEAAFEPPPGTFRGPGRELVRGAYKLDGRLLLVLDPAAVLAL